MLPELKPQGIASETAAKAQNTEGVAINTEYAGNTNNNTKNNNTNSTNTLTQDNITSEEEKTSSRNLFPEENIILNAKVADKTEAIRLAGNLLKDHGYVEPEYIDAMIQRDREASVYLGNHFATHQG